MRKKSGLADSPFFSSTVTHEGAVREVLPSPLPIALITPNASEEDEENPIVARNRAIGQARLSERPNAGMPEIGQSGKTENHIARKPEIMNAISMAESVQAALKTKAMKKESFRFPFELMDELADIPHEVRKKHQKHLSKTAIFVAALAAYLWDFRQNGDKSLFYQQLIEQQSEER